QRTCQAILEIRGDEPTDVAEVVPDGALEKVLLQESQRPRGEQVVEIYRARLFTTEAADEIVAVRAFRQGAIGEFRGGSNVDRRVVVIAQHLALLVGQRGGFLPRIPRDVFICSCERLEARAIMTACGEVAELLGVVPQLGTRRFRQGLCRDPGLVVAPPQLVCAREMVERTSALAFRKPQETERAVRIVVLGLDRAGATEALDRLPCPTERRLRDCAIVMRRRVARFDGDRPIEVADR